MAVDINLQTKIATLLKVYPELEERLIELVPAFDKLRNPILRRTIAKVTSLQQAAAMAQISAPVLVQTLRQWAGLAPGQEEGEATVTEVIKEEQPRWFDEQQVSMRLDVQPILDAGESPMQDILKRASSLSGDAILQICTPFQTLPIIDLLRSKGFQVWVKDEIGFYVRR